MDSKRNKRYLTKKLFNCSIWNSSIFGHAAQEWGQSVRRIRQIASDGFEAALVHTTGCYRAQAADWSTRRRDGLWKRGNHFISRSASDRLMSIQPLSSLLFYVLVLFLRGFTHEACVGINMKSRFFFVAICIVLSSWISPRVSEIVNPIVSRATPTRSAEMSGISRVGSRISVASRKKSSDFSQCSTYSLSSWANSSSSDRRKSSVSQIEAGPQMSLLQAVSRERGNHSSS